MSSAATLISPNTKKVLHVGCGHYHPSKLHQTFHTGEWTEIRLDIDPDVKPDIVGDIVSMTAVGDASVDAVWSSHNLEHLYSHQVATALSEFYRVLKPGGFVLLTMPDLQQVAELIAQGRLEDTAYVSPAGPIAPLDMVYGFRQAVAQGNYFMSHKTGFTAGTLGQKLAQAGFANIRVERENFALWGVGHRI